MNALCENCRAIAYCVVKLLAIKVEELDVCGSLVLSNPVTFVVFVPPATVYEVSISQHTNMFFIYLLISNHPTGF